jgi:hypothetical protein
LPPTPSAPLRTAGVPKDDFTAIDATIGAVAFTTVVDNAPTNDDDDGDDDGDDDDGCEASRGGDSAIFVSRIGGSVERFAAGAAAAIRTLAGTYVFTVLLGTSSIASATFHASLAVDAVFTERRGDPASCPHCPFSAPAPAPAPHRTHAESNAWEHPNFSSLSTTRMN